MAFVGPRSILPEDLLRRQQDRDVVLVERFNRQVFGSVTQQIVQVAGYSIFLISTAFAALTAMSTLYGLTLFVAVPLLSTSVLIGGVSFYIAKNYINLNNPAEIGRIRNEITKDFRDFELQQEQGTLTHLRSDAAHIIEGIAEKYGWDAIFYYGLPEPEIFAEIFHFQARLLSMSEVIHLYEKVTHKLEAARVKYGDNLFEFEVPHPSSFADKWRREVIHDGRLQVHVSSLFAEGKIEKLHFYNIIDEGEYRFLCTAESTFHTAYTTFCKTIFPEWKALSRALKPAKSRFMAHVASIHREYARSSVHVRLRNLRKKQLQEMEEINEQQRNDRDLERSKNEYESFRQSLSETLEGGPSPSRETAERYLHSASDRLQHARVRVREKYKPQKDALKRRYKNAFNPLFRELELATQVKNRKLAFAAKQFNDETALARGRYEVLIREKKERYFSVLEGIKREYLRHCA